MSAISVKRATREDVGALLDMMGEFNRLEEIDWSRARGESALSKLLDDAELGVVGLFQEGGEGIGYFVLTWGFDLEWNGRDAFLTELYLVAARGGVGRGRALMAHVEGIAKAWGANALHLMVRPENQAARTLYEGCGYRAPPRVFFESGFAVARAIRLGCDGRTGQRAWIRAMKSGCRRWSCFRRRSVNASFAFASVCRLGAAFGCGGWLRRFGFWRGQARAATQCGACDSVVASRCEGVAG